MNRTHVFRGWIWAALALPMPGLALDFQVSRLDDPVPNGCIAGDCSLREAVVTSNQLSGPDRILLPAGLYLLTRAGSGDATVGDLDIVDTVEIVGAGAETTVILASHDNRHFNIAGSTVTMRHLRLDGGRAGFGGSILHNGSLTLEDATLSNNQATIDGGALRSASGQHMVVRRVRFIDNSAAEDGGAIRSGTPGVWVSDSVFEDNSAGIGGAIAGYDIHVRDSLFDGNSASGNGGAIYGEPGCSCSIVEISGSTFSGNQAGSMNFGGALHVAYEFSVQLSTFAGNSAGGGGAIYVSNAGLGGPYRIAASTFAGNSATLFGSALYFNAPNSANLTLTNTIVAGGCFRAGAGTGVIGGLGNVESPGNTCSLGAGNLANVTAGQLALGALADNGGPTPTQLPGPASVAIGAGREADCAQLDQRGYVRHDGDCDAGSVEAGALDDVIFRNGLEL